MPNDLSSFVTIAGSVAGREHLRVRRNNQDAAGAGRVCGALVAVVADGCSSGGWSEVGARAAVAWALRALPELSGDTQRWARDVGRGLLDVLRPFARGLAGGSGALPAVVRDLFLFSLLVAVVTEERAVVIGAGDGLFAVDGRVRILDPGPENAPAYLGYALLDEAKAEDACVVHHDGPSAGLASLLVATDGAIPLGPELEAIARAPRYAKNPSLLEKRLAVLQRDWPGLGDDVSVAAVRRRVEVAS